MPLRGRAGAESGGKGGGGRLCPGGGGLRQGRRGQGCSRRGGGTARGSCGRRVCHGSVFGLLPESRFLPGASRWSVACAACPVCVSRGRGGMWPARSTPSLPAAGRGEADSGCETTCFGRIWTVSPAPLACCRRVPSSRPRGAGKLVIMPFRPFYRKTPRKTSGEVPCVAGGRVGACSAIVLL